MILSFKDIIIGVERKGTPMAGKRTYMCIDLKSFYASVECVERGLDPMKAKLVVADPSRTEKTICLAVTPALKAMGVKNRCRVFEIPKGIEYIMAQPRMALYIDYSARIYAIYLRYVSAGDIHIYSIDEVFMDVTDYLPGRSMDARQFARAIMDDIKKELGITATCGIGTNLYLAKIALDIISKHCADCIGVLTEDSYRKQLWDHRPMTDFWRIGAGTVRRLERLGIQTMGEVAHADEKVLYKTFGIDAELLIDHAWGRESTTMADIKNYRPETHSISSGQVLSCAYGYEKGKLIVKEMAEALALDLFDKGLVTSSITLSLGYSYSSGKPPVNGSISTEVPTCSVKTICGCTELLYDRIMNRSEPIYRLTLCFNNVKQEQFSQYDLFSPPEAQEKERRLQSAVLSIKKKYGKNGIVKCMDLQEGATMMERNRQIGGHRA